MSLWSYVNGVIGVTTCARSSEEAIYIAQTVVNHLPKIYGSEGDVEFYLNLVNGTSCSAETDEFGRFRNLDKEGWFDYQQNVLITVNGCLRDAEFETTLKETAKMLSRLSSKLLISSCLVSVSSFEKKFVFCDPDFLLWDGDKMEDFMKLLRGN